MKGAMLAEDPMRAYDVSGSTNKPTESLDVATGIPVAQLSKGLHNSTLLRFCDRLGLLLASLEHLHLDIFGALSRPIH